MFDRIVRGVEEVYVWSNRDPWLTIRRVACETPGAAVSRVGCLLQQTLCATLTSVLC